MISFQITLFFFFMSSQEKKLLYNMEEWKKDFGYSGGLNRYHLAYSQTPLLSFLLTNAPPKFLLYYISKTIYFISIINYPTVCGFVTELLPNENSNLNK